MRIEELKPNNPAREKLEHKNIKIKLNNSNKNQYIELIC
jgi:hypothetical protein